MLGEAFRTANGHAHLAPAQNKRTAAGLAPGAAAALLQLSGNDRASAARLTLSAAFADPVIPTSEDFLVLVTQELAVWLPEAQLVQLTPRGWRIADILIKSLLGARP